MSSSEDDSSVSSQSFSIKKKRKSVIRAKREKEAFNSNSNQYKACDECKRIKKKCDGGIPCIRCVAVGLSCKFNQRPSKSYTEELQKRIKELEDQLKQKELEQPAPTDGLEQKYIEINSRIIARASRLCKLSSISDILSVYSDAIGPNLIIGIPYTELNEFFTDNNEARVSMMNMILATGSELMGQPSRALMFENQALSKSSTVTDDKSYFRMATLVLASYTAVNHGEMVDADKYIMEAIAIGRHLLLKRPEDQSARLLLWKALEMKISWSTVEDLMQYVGLFMQLQTTAQLPLFDRLRNIFFEVGMAAQEALKKRKVFAYKLYQPQLDDAEQSLETLPPLLRAEMAIRLAIVRAWCYFAAHSYSEAEACCDRAIEMCLQLRPRVQWSAYTLAAMFTMHQIYLCTQATQKTNMLLEMFKEASQTSGWARMCLQNITAYVSGYSMAPFFDKITIPDIINDFGVAVPVHTNHVAIDYSNSSSPDSSSGHYNSSNNSSIPEQNYVPEPARHYPTENSTNNINININHNVHYNQPQIQYNDPQYYAHTHHVNVMQQQHQYSHHVANPNHGPHYS